MSHHLCVKDRRENTGHQTKGKKHLKQSAQTGSESCQIQNQKTPGDTRADDRPNWQSRSKFHAQSLPIRNCTTGHGDFF